MLFRSGAVKAVSNIVTAPASIASSVAGAIPGVGPILGPVVGGITGGPVGFATSLASQALQGNYGGGGGGGGSFTGNLLGNSLVDTTNLRVLVNASPYSPLPTYSSTTAPGIGAQFVYNTPVYSNSNTTLTPQSGPNGQQTVTMAASANILLLSANGSGGVKSTVSSFSYVSA